MIKSISTPKGAIVIREASLVDVEQFRNLRLFALQESPLAFSADYEISINHPLEYWQNRLKEDDNSVTFIAEYENKLIAMTGVARRPLPKTKHSAGIYGVFVHPDWRGLHIAGFLIDSCIGWARSRDVIIIKLGVNASNTSAIRCYQRCGFTIYGTEPRGTFYNGQYYDGYLMFKSLDYL